MKHALPFLLACVAFFGFVKLIGPNFSAPKSDERVSNLRDEWLSYGSITFKGTLSGRNSDGEDSHLIITLHDDVKKYNLGVLKEEGFLYSLQVADFISDALYLFGRNAECTGHTVYFETPSINPYFEVWHDDISLLVGYGQHRN